MFNVERTVGFDQQLQVDNPVDVTTAFFFQANLYYRGEYRRVKFIILWVIKFGCLRGNFFPFQIVFGLKPKYYSLSQSLTIVYILSNMSHT